MAGWRTSAAGSLRRPVAPRPTSEPGTRPERLIVPSPAERAGRPRCLHPCDEWPVRQERLPGATSPNTASGGHTPAGGLHWEGFASNLLDDARRRGGGRPRARTRHAYPSPMPARRSPAVPMIENQKYAGGAGSAGASAPFGASPATLLGGGRETTRTGADSLTIGVSATVEPTETAPSTGPAALTRASARRVPSSPSRATMPLTISWRSRQSASVSRSIASAETASFRISAAPASNAFSSVRGQLCRTGELPGARELPATGEPPGPPPAAKVPLRPHRSRRRGAPSTASPKPAVPSDRSGS